MELNDRSNKVSRICSLRPPYNEQLVYNQAYYEQVAYRRQYERCRAIYKDLDLSRSMTNLHWSNWHQFYGAMLEGKVNPSQIYANPLVVKPIIITYPLPRVEGHEFSIGIHTWWYYRERQLNQVLGKQGDVTHPLYVRPPKLDQGSSLTQSPPSRPLHSWQPV